MRIPSFRSIVVAGLAAGLPVLVAAQQPSRTSTTKDAKAPKFGF